MRRPTAQTRIAALVCWAIPATMSAGLLVLAFPPFDWPLLAWLALVPLFLQLQRSRVGAGFFAGCLTGTLFYMGLLGWTAAIAEINLIHFLILGIVLGSFFGLFAGGYSWLAIPLPKLAPLVLPTLWVSIEYLRSHIGFLSQPFGILGYSQYSLLPVAGVAAYTGVLGVSFLVVLCNALLATLVRHYVDSSAKAFAMYRRTPWPTLSILGVSSLMFGWLGLQAIAGETPEPKQTLSVAIVQGNAHSGKELSYQQYLDEVLPVYEQLTRAAAGASLVVWPSSSVPGLIPADRTMTRRLSDLASDNNTFLLIGAAGFDKFNTQRRHERRIANSAFLFAPSGSLKGRYDKIRLLPFDEYLPARDVIPWPGWLVKTEITDSTPGKELTVFNAGQSFFGVQICFENMFPEQSRQLARKGALFLVGQTNESYTDSLAGLYQNLAYYVFRAIENRMPVLRSSTTGISCIIDATGRVIASVQDDAGRKVGVAGFVTAPIAIGNETSFYTRHGDLFAYVCLGVIAFLSSIVIFMQIRSTFALQQKSYGG